MTAPDSNTKTEFRAPTGQELRRSAEVSYDRLSLILLCVPATLMLVLTAASVWIVVTHAAAALNSTDRLLILFIFLAVFQALIAAGIVYYARSMACALRRPEDYMVCRVYLSNPRRCGRNLMGFEARITLPKGRVVKKNTRGVIPADWLNGYNGDANREGRLECAYDPLADRLLILPTWEETIGFDM